MSWILFLHNRKQQNVVNMQSPLREIIMKNATKPSQDNPIQKVEVKKRRSKKSEPILTVSESTPELKEIETTVFPTYEPVVENIAVLENVTETVEVEPLAIKYYLQTQGEHYVLAEACVGLQHRNQKPYPLPCQDAVKAVIHPRPILIACDGAGSSAVSEIGSAALTVQLTRLCQSIEPILPLFLDVVELQQDMVILVRMIIRHAMGVLQDLSQIHRRDIKDFRSTLNFAMIGQESILWIKVGDGEIVQEKVYTDAPQPEQLHSELYCIGEQVKGEFANQTQFIDQQLQFTDVQWGVLKRKETTGLALMSDGASEKLVALQRDRVSGQVSEWLDQLRHDQLKASDICKRFYSEEFNARSTGDDRSIVLWTQNLEKP